MFNSVGFVKNAKAEGEALQLFMLQRLFTRPSILMILTKGVDMSDHGHEHEDHSVCVKVAVFFVAVIAAIFFIGLIN